MKKTTITAVVLNYNSAEDTIKCIESLFRVDYSNFNIVIVDNLSPDGSFLTLNRYFNESNRDYRCFASVEEAMLKGNTNTVLDRVTLIQAGSNKGYGHGNNIGIRYALKNNSDYILVLNNDTIVQPDFLVPLVEACEKDRKIGIASGKIYFHDQPDKLWYAGGRFSPLTAKVEHFYFNQKDTGQKIPEPVTFITGCFWFVPAKTFETVGLINEEYFMYVEDLEFCYRVLNHGLTLKIAEASKVFHKVGSSSGGHLSEFSIYWLARNKIKFITHNLQSDYRLTALFYTTLIAPVRLLLKGCFRLFIVYIKGLAKGFRE